MEQNLTEERLRAQIRLYIREDGTTGSSPLLFEQRYAVNMSTDDWRKIFIEPWATFLKGVKVEAKKFASTSVLLVRLLFTLNQKRAEEMVARHKDRMKAFKKESDEIMNQLGADNLNDMDLLSFLSNPGWVIGKKLLSVGWDAAKDTKKFAQEIGLSDKSIATVQGEESEEDALLKRREQKGPVRKALDALEQIFLFAGHAPGGRILAEAAAVELGDQITQELMAGPLGEQLKQARQELAKSVTDFVELVKSVGAQNEFLAGIGSPEMLQNLVNMRTSVGEFEKLNPKAAQELSKMLDALEADAKELAQSEEFQKQFQPAEDEEAQELPSPEEMYEKALTAVTGEVFNEQYQKFLELIGDNRELLVSAFDEMFPNESLTDETVQSLNQVVPGFKDSIRLAERILEKELRS